MKWILCGKNTKTHVICCKECSRANWFQGLINVPMTSKSQSMDRHPQGFENCLHTCLPQVPHIQSRIHTLCLCTVLRNYLELYRVTLWIIMVWYTMLRMAQAWS